MIESELQYADTKKNGTRFIDQIRTDPPADTGFVQRKFLDLAYAQGSEKRKLDIYLPNEGTAPYPVIIDIFGGGWYFGKRSSYKMNLALELLKKGYAVVSMDYSLSKEAKFPTQIYEVKAAVRYVKNHADEYGLDRRRVALLGESAGSHIGSVAALSHGAGVYEDVPFGETGDASVQCMIALYCPTDFALEKSQFNVLGLDSWVPEMGRADSPEGVLLGAQINDVPTLVQLANPETFVTKNSPPFQFFHGSDDRVVPYLQSMNLAVKLVNAIGANRVEHHLVPGAGHNQTHFMKEEYYDMMIQFLKKNLG